MLYFLWRGKWPSILKRYFLPSMGESTRFGVWQFGLRLSQHPQMIKCSIIGLSIIRNLQLLKSHKQDLRCGRLSLSEVGLTFNIIYLATNCQGIDKSTRNSRRKPHRAITAPILDCKEFNCKNIQNEIAIDSLWSIAFARSLKRHPECGRTLPWPLMNL
jgi:hypothetical protein